MPFHMEVEDVDWELNVIMCAMVGEYINTDEIATENAIK